MTNRELVFIDRSPSYVELEKLRLLLSVFQDGSGGLRQDGGGTLPDYRNFERACAIAFNGIAVESKFPLDVIFELNSTASTFYGIDCKMKHSLREVRQKGRLYIEVTNASRDLWSFLEANQLSREQAFAQPRRAGELLVSELHKSKSAKCAEYPLGRIEIDSSFFLALPYNKVERAYQLFLLPISLPDGKQLDWQWRLSNRRRDGVQTQALVATDSDASTVIEWYANSGGQLKYYPSTQQALWSSPEFILEELDGDNRGLLVEKVRTYFPGKWPAE